MPKVIKTIWNILTNLLVACVVLLAVALVGVRLMGFEVFAVLSGSMEPTYPVGSLIYVRDADPYALKEGDVITFLLDEDTVATHRIVEVVPDDEDRTVVRFATKGDANDAVDGSLVHYKNVIGTPVFAIPKLGYLASYIQNPPGTYYAICAGAILILLVFIPDLFASEEPDKKKKKSAAQEEAAQADYDEYEAYDDQYDGEYAAEYDEAYDGEYAEYDETYDGEYAEYDEAYDGEYAEYDETYDGEYAEYDEAYDGEYAEYNEAYDGEYAEYDEYDEAYADADDADGEDTRNS